ncbi:hypothetical protein SAMN05660477_00619 [Soonwooa buanensis]|uniref:Phosphoribosyl-ATP pyrophosphatase n=1 Tax=Soonwooa buanensis TaxID=619805 RepID=A0A1T5D523_9FLAO|nr:phosphoribosyl-ATP pyrophosphatase [Soonwooa buanensis]SKB66643.1 hypothetical protein SAMN05660477_00619 [Soonwooa buanensis]
MSHQYNNLDELRRKKALLRDDIKNMEELLTFKNKKESLSVLTNGITDKYLKESEDDEGNQTLSLNTKNIMREVSEGIRETTSPKSLVGLANNTVDSGLLETAVRLGAVTLVGNYARKNLNNSNWNKKIIGLALVYVAPFALKFIREKLEDYQRHKTASSLEKLI